MRRKLVYLAGLFLLLTRAAAAEGFADLRTIFVDRFDYTFSTSHINQIMENSANLGFTDVVFQVRGRGDAFYNSNFEPRANNLSAGFDPLQTALDAAHSRGLKLHAWINTTTLWNTDALNPPTGHMFHKTNPSFRLVDINGNVEPQSGWSNYSSVNPILPEVHTHINNVVNDIASNYDVDGINLDYIRYIPGSGFDRLPHDALSHQMFFNATGLDGSQSQNASAYRGFVRDRITDLVASIKNTVDAVEASQSRTIELSADVWRDPDVAVNNYLQDYRTWLEDDLLDIAMPMMYLNSGTDNLFIPNLTNTLGIATNTKIAPTLGVYLHDADNGGVALTVEQLQRLHDYGTDGAGVYDYPAVFTGSLASARQTAIANFYESIENPPPAIPTVLADFETSEEPFAWKYNTSPSSQTFGLLAGTTIERVTSEAQQGGASQELSLVGESTGWSLRHNSGVGSPASPASNVPFATTGFVGFWLKTDAAGVEVQIALDNPGTADRGVLQPVIADGDWHLYEWNLDDDEQWEGWATGDGLITGSVATLDSIFFYGAGDATLYLDTVLHNPDGSLLALVPIAGDYNGDGWVDTGDYQQWKTDFGQSLPAGSGADGNGDGVVDAADYTFWRDRLGTAASPAALAEPASLQAVPEPGAMGIVLMAVVTAYCWRFSRQ